MMLRETGGGVLLNLPIRTRDSSAAMTPAQVQFFGEFRDYTIDNNATALENFKRLSGLRSWGVGAPAWCSNWNRCFGRPYDKEQYPFQDESHNPYFDNFPTYLANPRLNLNVEFGHLAASMGWEPGTGEWSMQRARCLRAEFAAYYDKDMTDLQKWQKLCKEVGLEAGPSVTKCKKALKGIHINLVNLMDCRRKWRLEHGPDDLLPEDGLPDLIKFPNYRSFLVYTKSKKSRVFPKAQAKADGFLKALLRELLPSY